MTKYEVRYTYNMDYGLELFTEAFEDFEEAEARATELKALRFGPGDVEVIDLKAEAEAKVAELEAFIKVIKA